MDAVVRSDSKSLNYDNITIEEIGEQKNIASIQSISPNAKVDKFDPRTNQHFIKFVKHRGETIRLWECSICGREFQHQYMLRRHLPGHTDERNYHCLVCGKSFRQLSTLSQHRTIHSLDRPHTCMICGKNFNRISTLISHRKTHLDEKPFKCHICCKGFHQKGNLRNHLFSHTNERPYRCNLCDKGFNQQSNLTCHLKKVHPGNKKEIAKIISPVGDFQSPIPKAPPMDMLFPMDINNGFIMDPIQTSEMKTILQQNQVPFALLKHNGSRPVLVKIFVSNIPNGKHMLVPVTAQDLINGGKLILGQSENEKENLEYFDVSSPLLHLHVPLTAVIESYISPDGHHNITVHPPSLYSDGIAMNSDNVEVANLKQENNETYNHIVQNQIPEEYIVGGTNSLHDLVNFQKGNHINRGDNLHQPMVSIPSKDPVLNNAHQTGEGSGLIRPDMQYGSPQHLHHLLDPHGPPSYATDYDCRNLQLFEPLDFIDSGKIKHEVPSSPSGDVNW